MSVTRGLNRRRVGVIAMVVGLLLAFAPAATAAAPNSLLRIPESSLTPGAGAGQLSNARHLAADPQSGRLFVSEIENARISEFTAWGEFVKAWGWDVAPDGAPGDTPGDELEVCTESCQAGVQGSGSGQLTRAAGVAIDGAGDVYVYDATSLRVQKFDPGGEFLLMFGRQVNKTKVAEREEQEANAEPVTVTPEEEDLCTAASGHICGEGVAIPTDDRSFSGTVSRGYLAFNPVTGTIFVGDVDRVQEFGTDGTFESKFSVAGTVVALAIDDDGNLYYATGGEGDVQKVSPTGAPVAPLKFNTDVPLGVAVDVDGNVYVSDNNTLSFPTPRVRRFNPDGDEDPDLPEGFDNANDSINGVAAGFCEGSDSPGNLYVVHFTAQSAGAEKRSYVNVFGSPPIGCAPPPIREPVIHDQFALAVDAGGAQVKAVINPRFWDDTTYRVQYGTEPCSAGGCVEKPLAPGLRLTEDVINAPLPTAAVFLGGLKPDTTYHYRFIAESGGGGPVVGSEATFKTFRAEDAIDACPGNDLPRSGPSRELADCRAYEMVSPLDKNNGDILSPDSISGWSAGVHQSSTSGGRLTYSSFRSFADPESAPFVSQFLAERHAGDSWVSEAISPPRTRLLICCGPLADWEFSVFTDDLCRAWLRNAFDPPLAQGAVPGFLNLYRRGNCGVEKGGYLPLTTTAPEHAEVENYSRLELQGTSADGSHAIYVAPDNLTPEAPTNENLRSQLYEHVDGQPLRFVCILPTGLPTSQACSAGTGSPSFDGRRGSFHNAISADGERIFWSEAQAGPGRLFVRFEGESASREVSESVSGAKARFWGAASNGTRAVFTIEEGTFDDNLYRFDVDSGATPVPLAGDVIGVLGMSEDATHVYFLSTEALTGAQENSEGDVAQAGQPNLYLDEEGVGTTFVATLTAADASLATAPPLHRTVRVAPGGDHAAFLSVARLTGYDNTDANSGQADTEVFLYDAAEERLVCASCNPSGARPKGREVNQNVGGAKFWAAAKIPGSERALYSSRALSDDGDRLFFESFEALVPRDTNGVQDVYQWEALGAGGCGAGDSTFSADSGGCVELISSGEGARDASFVEASPSGDDVFFSTLSSLVPHDFGLVDIYDARVGGGLPPPVPPKPPCVGEACQSPPPPPAEVTPASEAYVGPGNPQRRADGKRCAKGKQKVRKGARKGRCVKKKKKRRAAARKTRKSKGAAR